MQALCAPWTKGKVRRKNPLVDPFDDFESCSNQGILGHFFCSMCICSMDLEPTWGHLLDSILYAQGYSL